MATYEIKSIRIYPHVREDEDCYSFDEENAWDGPVVGLQAVADVTLRLSNIPEGYCGGPQFRSAGLWGIQVESERDPCLAEVYEEEVEELFEQLAVFGIARDQCVVDPFPAKPCNRSREVCGNST